MDARALGERNRGGKIPNEFLTHTQTEIEKTRVVIVVKRMCERDGKSNETRG